MALEALCMGSRWRRGGLVCFVKDRSKRIDRAVCWLAYDVGMLLRVRDEELIRLADQVLRKASGCLEKVIG